MGIPKRTGGFFVLGAAAALLIGISTPPAFASTWTVSPGGAFQAPMPSAGFLDAVNHDGFSCGVPGHDGSDLQGAFRAGTGPGSHLGRVGVAQYMFCSSGNTAFTVTASNFPWHLNAVSYASGATTGHLTGIHLVLSGNDGCHAIVDGTSATAGNGSVKFTYRNSGHLVIGPGSALHLYDVTNCGTRFSNGDLIFYNATSFSVSPRQTITSP
jgi:hypothetical protein